mmetsp:Transcript_19300/g.41708  ORF Transcript_19300/g.41708 Transcript_19300/m.41708 type:complete len:105 (+) Transcript_19300:397-711(+)
MFGWCVQRYEWAVWPLGWHPVQHVQLLGAAGGVAVAAVAKLSVSAAVTAASDLAVAATVIAANNLAAAAAVPSHRPCQGLHMMPSRSAVAFAVAILVAVAVVLL